MSITGQIDLYKGGNAAGFRLLAEETLAAFLVETPEPKQPWETLTFTIDSQDDIHALQGGGRYGVNYEYSKRLRQRRGGVSIEVYLQDGWWDYVLYESDQIVDRFSTWPEQFLDPDGPAFEEERRKYAGDAALLARLWGLPREQIKNYVRQWGERIGAEGEFVGHLLTGKAYPADQYEYGWSYQYFDFVRALGYQHRNRAR